MDMKLMTMIPGFCCGMQEGLNDISRRQFMPIPTVFGCSMSPVEAMMMSDSLIVGIISAGEISW
jgi:hypothetical protein